MKANEYLGSLAFPLSLLGPSLYSVWNLLHSGQVHLSIASVHLESCLGMYRGKEARRVESERMTEHRRADSTHAFVTRASLSDKSSCWERDARVRRGASTSSSQPHEQFRAPSGDPLPNCASLVTRSRQNWRWIPRSDLRDQLTSVCKRRVCNNIAQCMRWLARDLRMNEPRHLWASTKLECSWHSPSTL